MARLTHTRLLATAVLSATVLAPVAAQNQTEHGPTVEVHLRTMKRSGGTSMTGFGSSMFVPGSTVTWFLTAGSSDPAGMTVCGGGVGVVGTLAEKLSSNAFVWEFKVVASKYDNATATFDLEWARYQADGGGRPSAEGKITLSLREGERQPIDLVHGAAGPRNCGDDAAIVEVGTGFKDSSQFAQSVLQYDLWLKHQPASGGTALRRFTAMGMQGNAVSFGFEPLRFGVGQTPTDASDYDVVTSVQGTIKGRAMANGRIALIVETSRRDGLGRRDAWNGGWSGNAGRKVIEVAPDEAVEIELPAPGGSSRATMATGAAATPRGSSPASAAKQAVSIVNGRIVVDNALFFQGQRTSLILQVKRVRS